MERFTLDLDRKQLAWSQSIPSITIFNCQIVRPGTLDGLLMALCGVRYTENRDLVESQTRDHDVPISNPRHPMARPLFGNATKV